MGKRANLMTETWLDGGKRQRTISLVSNPEIEVTCSHVAFRTYDKSNIWAGCNIQKSASGGLG